MFLLSSLVVGANADSSNEDQIYMLVLINKETKSVVKVYRDGHLIVSVKQNGLNKITSTRIRVSLSFSKQMQSIAKQSEVYDADSVWVTSVYRGEKRNALGVRSSEASVKLWKNLLRKANSGADQKFKAMANQVLRNM